MNDERPRPEIEIGTEFVDAVERCRTMIRATKYVRAARSWKLTEHGACLEIDRRVIVRHRLPRTSPGRRRARWKTGAHSQRRWFECERRASGFWPHRCLHRRVASFGQPHRFDRSADRPSGLGDAYNAATSPTGPMIGSRPDGAWTARSQRLTIAAVRHQHDGPRPAELGGGSTLLERDIADGKHFVDQQHVRIQVCGQANPSRAFIPRIAFTGVSTKLESRSPRSRRAARHSARHAEDGPLQNRFRGRSGRDGSRRRPQSADASTNMAGTLGH